MGREACHVQDFPANREEPAPCVVPASLGYNHALRYLWPSLVRDRSEELPYQVWSARVRVAELQRDYNEALCKELEPLVEPARQAADDHKRDALDPAEAEQNRLREEAGRTSMEANSAFQQRRDAEHALERLLYAGPDDPLRPERAAG